MNPMPNVLNEDFTSSIDPDGQITNQVIDRTDTNIISLAEEGLLSPAASIRRENSIYHDYSPLNEW